MPVSQGLMSVHAPFSVESDAAHHKDLPAAGTGSVCREAGPYTVSSCTARHHAMLQRFADDIIYFRGSTSHDKL